MAPTRTEKSHEASTWPSPSTAHVTDVWPTGNGEPDTGWHWAFSIAVPPPDTDGFGNDTATGAPSGVKVSIEEGQATVASPAVKVGWATAEGRDGVPLQDDDTAMAVTSAA